MFNHRCWAPLALLGLALGGYATAEEPPKSEYRILKTIKLGGTGGWDYLNMDSAARRLYISRSNRVQVVDVDEGKLVGEIAKTPGVHGIALDAKRNQGFTSNGGENTITVFDLKTLAEKSRVKVGTGPDGILYDPASDRVFTFNGRSKDATAVSAETGKVEGTVALGGKPESAVSDEKATIYVTVEDKNEIVAFDAKKLTVINRWPIAPATEPVGLSMDRAKGLLFCSCHSKHMVVMEAASGKVLATPAIGRGTDFCVYDSELGRAYSSNSDGTLTVVGEKGGKFDVLADVKTQAGARTCALDTKTHNVLLVTATMKPAAKGGRPQPEPDSFVVLVVGK
jgi:DNA-binding beta-propeller fold protein YncE